VCHSPFHQISSYTFFCFWLSLEAVICASHVRAEYQPGLCSPRASDVGVPDFTVQCSWALPLPAALTILLAPFLGTTPFSPDSPAWPVRSGAGCSQCRHRCEGCFH
jgi:hypothetical protein